ncbi:MAG: glycosyltransferase [Actinomycetaceae bacterium]|nr:glycosyltransferase [Actinomycetaceae bacterium]
MPRLSVITPFYNVSELLFSACVDSILNQDFTDFEWIIVDDGSDEKSATMLDSYAARDERIHAYHCGNEGVSAARNSGLDVAVGDYFTFVDADDLVTPIFFSNSTEILDRTNADIAYGFLRRTGGNSILGVDAGDLREEVLTGNKLSLFQRGVLAGEKLPGLAEVKKYAPYPVAPKVYRRKVFSELRFRRGMPVGEDSLFNAMSLDIAQSIVLIPEHWYNYIIHRHSVSQAPALDKLLDQLAGFSAYIDEGSARGWNKSDVGMRYAHALVNVLSVLAKYTSIGEMRRFTKNALKLDAAAWLGDIDISNYELSPQFRLLATMIHHKRANAIVALMKAQPTVDVLKARVHRMLKN